MPMIWTNDLPTEMGPYWFRKSPEKRHSIVEVYRYSPTAKMAVMDKEGWSSYLDEYRKTYPECQWSSTRIPEPEEPKQ